MAFTYAKIDMNVPGGGVGTVVDTTMINQSDIDAGLDPNFAWVDISSMSPQPFINCTYNGTTFSGMAPTITLAQAKAVELIEFKNAMISYINSSYDLETRLRFLIMYTMAKENLQVNRAAYIHPLFDWGNACINYAATYTAQLQAMTDVATVQSAGWDFSLIGAVPSITLLGAISIPN